MRMMINGINWTNNSVYIDYSSFLIYRISIVGIPIFPSYNLFTHLEALMTMQRALLLRRLLLPVPWEARPYKRVLQPEISALTVFHPRRSTFSSYPQCLFALADFPPAVARHAPQNRACIFVCKNRTAWLGMVPITRQAFSPATSANRSEKSCSSTDT